jgi:hypothetical protein
MTGATRTLIESLSSHNALHVYLENSGFKAEVRRKSGHLSVSYPSQKKDGTPMLVDYFPNTLSSELLSDNFTSRKGRRLILFSDLRSPHNSVLTIVGWRASRILSSETVADDQVLTLHSLKVCASHYRVPDPDPKMNDQIKTILEGAVQNVWWTKNTIR